MPVKNSSKFFTKNYNPRNKKSVIAFAIKLLGSTLRKSCGKTRAKRNFKSKGGFGNFLEKYYFEYKPNSDQVPDFPEIGLELKSSSLKRAKNNRILAKERIVLNMINYKKLIKEKFESSTVIKKNKNLLLVFYLYEEGKRFLDYKILLVTDWEIPRIDLQIIKKDWNKINLMVMQGKAHEISEGDTLYLGASTKSASGKNFTEQPKSEILAKPRAFSLKQGYVNHILATIQKKAANNYGKIIQSEKVAKRQSLEEIVLKKFKKYQGMTIPQIEKLLGVKLNRSAKNYYSSLTKSILGIEMRKAIEEFEKANIKLKVVRIKDNDMPKEDMSFPYFKFEDLLNESWAESSFKSVLERKYLIVFFRMAGKKLVLEKARFWNMPYEDIIQAKQVWLRTRKILSNGEIVLGRKGKNRITNFPNKEFNAVSHVRPHAKNSRDTDYLPVIDKKTGLKKFTKQSFWLNNSYIRDEIYLK